MLRSRVYEEIVNFIAAGRGPAEVAAFIPSEATRARVFELVEKEKNSALNGEESSELDHYLQIEHLMRLSKARARQLLGNE